VTEQEVQEVMIEAGAILQGHFVLASGKHGDTYVNKDAIYPDTGTISRLCWELTYIFGPIFQLGTRRRVVIAPAVGGVILSQWVADHLTTLLDRKVLSLYADKGDDGGFVIKRGYEEIIPDSDVLVGEDVLTTGKSARQVVEAVRAHGGNVIGVGALCNRGRVTAKDLGGVPKLHALLNIDLESWPEEACPLCQSEIPINTNVGKGKEYLARLAQG